MAVQVAEVVLWGRVIGAVSWDASRALAWILHTLRVFGLRKRGVGFSAF